MSDDLIQAVIARSKRSRGCLLWQRSTTGGNGTLPQMNWRGKVINVRRELAKVHGLDVDGGVVRMRCCKGLCLERKHMVVVSHSDMAAENSRKRDRARVSEAAKQWTRQESSLSVSDVRTIFVSDAKVADLAARYGKSRALIHRIKNREVWADAIVTQIPRRPTKYEVTNPPRIFSSLALGNYLPSDSAIARAYGG